MHAQHGHLVLIGFLFCVVYWSTWKQWVGKRRTGEELEDRTHGKVLDLGEVGDCRPAYTVISIKSKILLGVSSEKGERENGII